MRALEGCLDKETGGESRGPGPAALILLEVVQLALVADAEHFAFCLSSSRLTDLGTRYRALRIRAPVRAVRHADGERAAAGEEQTGREDREAQLIHRNSLRPHRR